MQVENQYLDYLIDPSFQGVNKLFVLLYENIIRRTSYKPCFLPALGIKDYNDPWEKFFLSAGEK